MSRGRAAAAPTCRSSRTRTSPAPGPGTSATMAARQSKICSTARFPGRDHPWGGS
jgi:hypothetical protein